MKTKTKKPSKMQAAMDALAKHPDVNRGELAKKLNTTVSTVQNAVAKLRNMQNASIGDVERSVEKERRKNSLKSNVVSNPYAFDAALRIPEAGMTVKLNDGKNVIGTLQLTKSGLRFQAANAKKKVDRQLHWGTLNELLSSGLLNLG